MSSTKGEKTRETILQASKKLILKKGFTATSMRMIADEAKITPGAIYNHFHGKEEIFETLIDESIPLLEVGDQLTKMQVTDPEKALHIAIRQITETMLSHEDYIRLGLIDAQERQGKSVKKMLPRLYPIFMGFVAKVWEADKSLFREMPIEKFLRVLVSLVFGYVYTEVVVNPMEALPLPDVDWVDALVDVFMYGVVNRS